MDRFEIAVIRYLVALNLPLDEKAQALLLRCSNDYQRGLLTQREALATTYKALVYNDKRYLMRGGE